MYPAKRRVDMVLEPAVNGLNAGSNPHKSILPMNVDMGNGNISKAFPADPIQLHMAAEGLLCFSCSDR